MVPDGSQAIRIEARTALSRILDIAPQCGASFSRRRAIGRMRGDTEARVRISEDIRIAIRAEVEESASCRSYSVLPKRNLATSRCTVARGFGPARQMALQSRLYHRTRGKGAEYGQVARAAVRRVRL
jgi:hypothetical protein